MRLASCVLYLTRNGRAVALCVSEINGRLLCAVAGERGRWDGRLTSAETAEAVEMLEQDRQRPEVGESVMGRLMAAESLAWIHEAAA